MWIVFFMLNAFGYFYFTWISLPGKPVLYKPALNYLDISCPSLSGYLLAVSIVSFGIFGLLPLCCSWVCVSDNFSHERCESNRVMRAVFCCLLCFLRLIAHRRQTRREHILAMLSAPTIRSKGQSGAGQAAEWLTLTALPSRSHQCNAPSWTADQNGSRIF